MERLGWAIVAIASVAWAAAEPGASAQAPRTERDRLRDRARLVLEEHCGQCHIGAYDTAQPRALAVFDLAETEWSARMTVPQLIDTEGRVRDGRGPDGPIAIREDQVATIADFVRMEIARIGPL